MHHWCALHVGNAAVTWQAVLYNIREDSHSLEMQTKKTKNFISFKASFTPEGLAQNIEVVEEKQRSGSGDILEITNSFEFRIPGGLS